ncbi:Glucan endo-1,3-beta-glucosidase 8 [Apostasia shenzhenica]|uniref:Glucan endo-1,3-beta-glucosidase 8 n=1 Tax=Apostasia shenzhenica TaxID=1088818 RepID=A0A2I0A5X1_9ASPA|nr:Glucan endo-1,3-beta-glucosidase 8 [Apostasia shenzhenica]
MSIRMKALTWVSFLTLLSTTAFAAIDTIGINWGTMTSHPLPPPIVVKLLSANSISKVKLFDADEWTVSALAGAPIQVMLAIPNDQLRHIGSKSSHAKEWVKQNVTGNLARGVDVHLVAVGNEPFLKSYNGSFVDDTFPALRNIQSALDDAGIGDKIKATVPMNADVYSSPSDDPVPSAGDFRSDINGLMKDIVRFLRDNDAPFLVNIYPFISLYQSSSFPVEFAFFDGGAPALIDGHLQYTNVFDANYDTLVWALRKAGVPDMPIIVGEVGWPTDGDRNANTAMAKRFYDGFLRKMAKGIGTPLRPGKMEVYLFGLVDEDMKSVLPGNFERHWGIFTYDGRPKFVLDLDGDGRDELPAAAAGVQYLPAQWCVFQIAERVNYACSNADCTPLSFGSSCAGMGLKGNLSYAFNIYFQTMDQDVRACDFDGMAKITGQNASHGGCLFPVQIISGGGWKPSVAGMRAAAAMAAVALAAMVPF